MCGQCEVTPTTAQLTLDTKIQIQNLDLVFPCNLLKRPRMRLHPTNRSLELVQTHLLLSIAYFGIGYGRSSWRELGKSQTNAILSPGSAILLAFEMELHREPPLHAKSTVSLMDRELRRRCFWTCYILDRFLVCGSMRPMIIRDHDIKLRLPSSQESFVAGEPIEGSFFFRNNISIIYSRFRSYFI